SLIEGQAEPDALAKDEREVLRRAVGVGEADGAEVVADEKTPRHVERVPPGGGAHGLGQAEEEKLFDRSADHDPGGGGGCRKEWDAVAVDQLLRGVRAAGDGEGEELVGLAGEGGGGFRGGAVCSGEAKARRDGQ